MRSIYFWIVILSSSSIMVANLTTKATAADEIARLPQSAVDQLSRARIYFGHQSVGLNIMEGVQDLLKHHPQLKLTVMEISGPTPIGEGVFAHGRIGENWHPIKKIDDFQATMDNELVGRVDLAFFKFCYIDMMADQDADAVFRHYIDTLAKLKAAHPTTTFIHVTIPLTVVQTGPKAFVKKLLGTTPAGYLDNIKRNAYNQRLREHFAGREPVFDLAAIESTLPDGKRATFEWQGQTYERMVPEYASDGRHLNPTGRQIVATRLLAFLAATQQEHQLARTAAN